jgi:hypothetical protein
MNSTKIHIWDLPEDIVYIDLNPNFKKQIFISAKKSGSWKELSKILDISYSNLSGMLYENKKIKLKVLKNLLKLTKIDKDEIENNIILISLRDNGGVKFANAIINPKLPFNFNTIYGARVIASLFFDGGIDSDLYPHYSNENIDLRKKVYMAYSNLFGEFKAQFTNYRDRVQIYLPKIVGIIFTKCLGIQPGRKTVNNPEIPSFIMNSSKEMKSVFLQQAFDDEGHFHKSQRDIRFKLANGLFADKLQHEFIVKNNIQEYAPNLIKDVKRLTESFNIRTSNLKCVDIYQTKDGRYNTRWNFNISRKENLEKFQSEINFISDYKKINLKKGIDSIRLKSYPKNEANEIIYNSCLNLQKKEGKITSRTLAKEINRSQILAKKMIQRFVKKGLLKVSKERWGIKGAEYLLNHKNI